eukprot:TRINITY_DN2328_c0_g1_i7.p1 TRINITY_DN2328_c0_g1~~TRINITY_DN2328_c0_g1_i7.p1  ORF type:complete len:346 (-),score=27.36 TRINITY_DN2328_c0_g1_i7:335-1372(-)
MYYQSLDENAILEGVKKHGPAQGAQKILNNEYQHAMEALESGIYITYWCEAAKSECGRVGSFSKCFCGHLFKEHNKKITSKKVDTSCLSCDCKVFQFVPTRPEECGMWWLPRRKEFDVRTWRAKCKCTHTHEEHMTNRPHRCTKCGKCFAFTSDFACVVCDRLWEDHVVLVENEHERAMLKKPIGDAFKPLSINKEIQDIVFGTDDQRPAPSHPAMRARPVGNNAVFPKRALSNNATAAKKTATPGPPKIVRETDALYPPRFHQDVFGGQHNDEEFEETKEPVRPRNQPSAPKQALTSTLTIKQAPTQPKPTPNTNTASKPLAAPSSTNTTSAKAVGGFKPRSMK